MTIDNETSREDGATTGIAVEERPARPPRGARTADAPPRPRRAPRPAPPRRPEAPPRRPEAPQEVRREETARPSGAAPARRLAPRTPFVLLVVGLMCGGLVSLLLLNTVLAKDSFRANELQKSTQRLRQQEQDKRNEVLLKSQPEQLSRRAGELGEKPDDGAPQFLVPGDARASQSRVPAGTTADRAQTEVPSR
ncbi:hypothetical protein Sme01_61830 [Sphaerisporangium melleum]|uniref:Cell division protein FtsL n=1 Tax=Sphaerisporangium melleum TaxID=321316 RepID=A0A917RB39_9ACTN|nr:hypothetical protein [Sphaerisporangium melleum]GGK98182.1 hypothetical protein GCM10007964_45450 [Sphaerisporangium melleum]GII73707.1 hypothetical protein Sme01_61830 [Sphaerisporangium melleum]